MQGKIILLILREPGLIAVEEKIVYLQIEKQKLLESLIADIGPARTLKREDLDILFEPPGGGVNGG